MPRDFKKILRKNAGTSLSLVLLAIGIGLFVSYLVFGFSAPGDRLDNFIYDAWLETKAEKPDNPRVVIVDIDEASIRKMGQLPWPRTVLSELVTILFMQGAKAIGLDIWFTEPDRSSPVAVDSQLEKDFGLNLDFSKLPIDALDNDRYFRNTIVKKPVVLGALATFGGKEDFPPLMPQPVQVEQKEAPDGKLPGQGVAEITGMVSPLPVLAAVAPVGLLNLNVDQDGIVRSLPLLARAGEKFYPALALQTLLAANGEENLKLSAADDEALLLEFGDLSVPFKKDGSFNPVYYGPGRTLPFFSAIDVLDGKVGKKELEDKIIFIGASAHSQRNERSTPLDPAAPGTEVHATVAQNMLSGVGVHPAAHERGLQVCAIFFAAFVGVFLFRYFSLPASISIFLVLGALAFFGSWLCFQDGIFFSPIGSLSSLMLAGFCILPFRYFKEQSDRRKLRAAFSQYVAPEVVSRIVEGGAELLRGSQKEATVMFTDLRGFTGISEHLEPDKLVRLLNSYFTPMTASVTARQGTVDKFIGDAIMAFWNAPLDIENHETLAMLAALDMQSALDDLRPQIKNEFGVEIRMGIGVNTGLVQVGNMGSNELINYTCIGENVNLASRLEGMCKHYGVGIVASESVRRACPPDMPFLLLDKIRVKGSQKPLRIYTPLKDAHTLPQDVAANWNMALEAYFAGSFRAAEELFTALAEDAFLAASCKLFILRCRAMEEKPVENWDGVWTYQEK